LICGLWKYSGNNFCEEYDLLFTLAGIAVMLCRYTDTDRTKKWYAYALGVCTACVCFIKMSDILVLGVTILFYIYDVIRSKRSFWAEALRFLAGFALITVPVCLYLLFTGTFLPMIQEYILNNLVHIRVGKNTGFWASRKYIITHGYGLASIRPVINMAVGLILMLMIQPADERRQPFERKLRFYAVACTFAALLVGYVAGSGFFQHLVLEKNTNVLALLLVFRALAQRFSASAVPKFRRLSWVLSGIVLAAAIVFFVSALDPDQFIWSEKRQQELAELMEFNEEYQEYSDSVYALRITPRCFWINDIYPAYPYYNLSGFIDDNVGVGQAERFEEALMEEPIELLAIGYGLESLRGILTDETVEFIGMNYEVIRTSEYNESSLMRLI